MNLRHRPGRHDAATEALRDRVLGAARAMLAEARPSTAFSVDAVAARAGVARAIMQQQFGTSAGVLEALWDDLLARGCMAELPSAFQLDDPRATLAQVIAIYAAFWSAERTVIRRVKAHAALDPDLERALQARERDRREGMQRLAKRLAQRRATSASSALEVADVLCLLTAFETFDGLAGTEHGITEVVPVLQAFARAALAQSGG